MCQWFVVRRPLLIGDVQTRLHERYVFLVGLLLFVQQAVPSRTVALVPQRGARRQAGVPTAPSPLGSLASGTHWRRGRW